MIVMVLQNRRLLAHWGRVLEEHHYHQSMVIFQSTTPVRAGRGRASHLVRLARAGELEKELESNFYNSHTEKWGTLSVGIAKDGVKQALPAGRVASPLWWCWHRCSPWSSTTIIRQQWVSPCLYTRLTHCCLMMVAGFGRGRLTPTRILTASLRSF